MIKQFIPAALFCISITIGHAQNDSMLTIPFNDLKKLEEACTLGQLHKLQDLMVKHHKKLNTVINQALPSQFFLKNNSLHLATLNNHIHIIRQLIAIGADPSLSNAAGMTPLHLATLKGNRKLVEYFLAQNICRSALNIVNQTAYDIAYDNKDQELMHLLAPPTKSIIPLATINSSSRNIATLFILAFLSLCYSYAHI